MLDRYILLNHMRTFLILLVVLVGIIYVYLLGEFFLIFKNKSLEVLLSYTLNFLPTSFFYLSAFVNSLALLLAFRRLFQKRIDLLLQSFGISPLRFSLWVLLFALFLSLLNLFGSYRLYPESQRRLFNIEKEFKKARETEKGIVRNLWLVRQENGETNFYNFELVDLSTGRVHGFYLLRVKEGSIREMATASVGQWNGEKLEFPQAEIKDLVSGEEETRSISINFLEISQIGPLAQKPEHLPMMDVFALSMLGERIGINYRQYAYELVKRILTSFLPLFMILIVGWVYIRWRQFRFGLLALVASFSAHWFFLNTIRSVIENTNLSLYLAFFLYVPMVFLSLKGLYDLGKGFRV